MGLIIGVSLISIFVIGGALAWFYEIKTWNKGICANTGKPWEYFDTDSQGGRGYISGEYSCWITYPCVDKKKV